MKLVPAHIEKLMPYVPGKPIEETEREYGVKEVIKLASNENPLGPSPLARAALEASVRQVHLYPDGSNYRLVRKLASVLGVEPEWVFVGAGSNEVIELLIHTFMDSGDEAVICRGSFPMYKVSLQSHGRTFAEVPMREGHHDLEGMAAAITPRTRMVFFANPDNPTGSAFSRAALDRFLARVPPGCLAVLDEAYFEYVRWDEYPNGLDYVRERPNVVVLRTFSKIYGLAGLRLGYGVMRPEMVSYLNRTRMPFNINLPAQAAAVAALDDREHVRTTLEITWRGLDHLTRALRALGISVQESHANFLFADLGRPAAPVYEQLLRRGIITRPLVPSGFPSALRITVGLHAHHERLISALKEIL